MTQPDSRAKSTSVGNSGGERVPANTDQVVYLFTSNAQKRYKRDAIEAISLPRGCRIRFRYKRMYVSEELQADWASGLLVGRSCLILFSVQHQNQLHEAYFVPLRWGTIAASSVDGSSFLVDITVGDFQPSLSPEGDQHASTIRGIRTRLMEVLGANHPDNGKSAVRADPVALESPDDESTDWESVVEALDATGEFPKQRHYRVSTLTDNDGTALKVDDEGRFHLTAQHSYRLRFSHHHPGDVDDVQTVRVSALDSEAIEFIGKATIEISSRYDTHEIAFRAKDVSRNQQTGIVVSPDGEGVGVTLEIPLTISFGRLKRVAVRSIGPAIGGLFLSVPGLAAVDDRWGWPTVAVAVGVATWGVLAYFGTKPFSLSG
ncbi:hypothetical protein [Gemmatimonas sp.]|uniref:hypothetical protein n=1 Tax=Gemmatimonas sp. TaxID=1962908 RepID=UPI00356875A0